MEPIRWPYCFHFSHLFTFHGTVRSLLPAIPKEQKSLQLKSKQTRKPIRNGSLHPPKSLRECLIFRKPLCCFLFLKGLQFLISSWKTGTSRAAHSSQDWGHEAERIPGFFSVTFYFSVKLLSHVPISDTWIVFWPRDDCYSLSYGCYACGFGVFAQLYFSA